MGENERQWTPAHAIGWAVHIGTALQSGSALMRHDPHAMTPHPVRASTTAAPRAGYAVAAPETDGYMISTLELSAGLDVEPVALSTLSHETLRELLRLRSRWASPARLAA